MVPLSFPECEGFATNEEIVDETTINRFRGCNIITSGSISIGRVTNLK